MFTFDLHAPTGRINRIGGITCLVRGGGKGSWIEADVATNASKTALLRFSGRFSGCGTQRVRSHLGIGMYRICSRAQTLVVPDDLAPLAAARQGIVTDDAAPLDPRC